MKGDFELIVHKLDKELDYINIYPMCEPHFGSPNFSEVLWKKWTSMVLADERGKIVITGDLFDNGLKTSKTNSYQALMSPSQQLEYGTEQLKPMQDRILGMCSGNHEQRSADSTDTDQLYILAKILGIDNVYRENMAFLKINLGERKSYRQVSYTMVLGHGGSKAKTDKFAYAIDGMDILVTGHTHNPNSGFPAKIVIDTHNECVRIVGFTHVVVPSLQTVGGYTLRGMYLPQDSTKNPIIGLNGKEKEVSILWK